MSFFNKISNFFGDSDYSVYSSVQSKNDLLNAIQSAMRDHDFDENERKAIEHAALRLGVPLADLNQKIKEMAVKHIVEEIQINTIDGDLSLVERTRITKHARGIGMTDAELDALIMKYAPNQHGFFGIGKSIGASIAQTVANGVATLSGITEDDQEERQKKEVEDIADKVIEGEGFSQPYQQSYQPQVATGSYFVVVNGQQHGPYSLQQMRQFIQQGRMNRNTQVIMPGNSYPMPAASDQNLLSMLMQYEQQTHCQPQNFVQPQVATGSYFVVVNGQQHGPYSLQQMRQFIQQGRMNRNTQVIMPGNSYPTPAASDQNLLNLLMQCGY